MLRILYVFIVVIGEFLRVMSVIWWCFFVCLIFIIVFVKLKKIFCRVYLILFFCGRYDWWLCVCVFGVLGFLELGGDSGMGLWW